MSEPDFKLFVVAHKKKTFAYTPEEVELGRKKEKPEVFDQLMKAGEWREFWIHEPTAKHEEQIRHLCLVKDEETGWRYDDAVQSAARCAVLVEKWNGFPEKPSMESFRALPLALAKTIDQQILSFMYPLGLDSDFFSSSNEASKSSDES